MADPRLAQAPTLHMGGTREQMALAEREVAAGRHRRLADGASPRCRTWPIPPASTPGPPPAVDLRARAVGLARRPDRDRHSDFRAFRARLPRSRGGRASRRAAGRPQRQPRRRRHRRRRQQPVHALAGPTPRLNPWTTPIPTRRTCARRRPRRAAACTAWPATTPPARCCAASSASRSCPTSRPDPLAVSACRDALNATDHAEIAAGR